MVRRWLAAKSKDAAVYLVDSQTAPDCGLQMEWRWACDEEDEGIREL